MLAVLVLLYVAVIVGANAITAATTPADIGPFLVTWGTWLIGATFVLRDAIHLRAGRRAAYAAIAVALAASAATSVLLGDLLWITAGSALSFLLAESADLEVFARLRVGLPTRIAASGTVGAIIDSTAFAVVALSPLTTGIVPWEHLPNVIAGQVLIKTAVQFIAAGGVYAYRPAAAYLVLLLTTAAHPTVVQYRQRPGGAHLGRLLTPRHYPRAADTADAGIPWAADNDGFGGVDFAAFERMLEALKGLPGCRFVTVPDVVADAAATFLLWDEWAPIVARYDLPAALVLQDGMTPGDIPWGAVDALFVGGTTAYKLGPEVRAILTAARVRDRRLWVHMGRVNSARRIAYAAQIGCDSVDGSGYSTWRETRLPDGVLAAAGVAQGHALAFEV